MNIEQFNKLLDFTSLLKECFTSSGKEIYLVGGIVRDIHAGLNDIFDRDLDFTTDATPDEIKTIIQPIAEKCVAFRTTIWNDRSPSKRKNNRNYNA